MAKLLGGLAITLAVLTFVASAREIPPLDLYFHDTYFVLVFRNFLLLNALTVGILAILHFAISRWTLRPPNHIVEVASFILIVVSLSILVWANFLTPKDSTSRWVALFGANFGFMLGILFLAANLAWASAWTMFRKVRSHLSSR